MIPILYRPGTTDFSTNGIGRLSDCISCVCTEERNGMYEVMLTYPIDGIHYSDIQEDALIRVVPSDGAQRQTFRIYKVERPIDGVVTVNAEHISYLLNRMVVMPYSASSCAQALAFIPSYTVGTNPFNFITDKNVTGSFNVTAPKAIRGMLGGEQGSILDVFGKGEYEFNNYDVILHLNRGSDSGVTLRYGKNITELENASDMSDTYTGIVPYWQNDTEVVTLPEKAVYSEHTQDFSENLLKVVDMSGEWQDAPTVEQLREKAQKYIRDNEGWKINTNIKVSFVPLWDTEEYKDVAALQRVHLCDTVTVLYDKLGVRATAKVVRTEYNVLTERYDSIEIGDASNHLGSSIVDKVENELIPQVTSHTEKAIAHTTALITGGLGGHLVIGQDANGHPNELLIMDTDDKKTATQVLRINLNGIGFGKSYNGPFNTAWTLDGHFNATYIDTGVLNADLIQAGIIKGLESNHNFWNMETGEISITPDGKTKGITYSHSKGLVIAADYITTGTLDGSKADIKNLNASNIISGVLNGLKVDVQNINASNINRGILDGVNVDIQNISATNITRGILDGVDVSIVNIDGANITAGTIVSEAIAAGAIVTGLIAAGAVTANEIAAQTITGDKIAGQTIEGSNIKGETIEGSNIKGGTITGNKIAGETIEGSNIKGNTITGNKIAGQTIEGSNIKGETIEGSNIKGGTITGNKIAGQTIEGSNIKGETIEGGNIKGGTITGNKIAGQTIEGSNIKGETIEGGNIKGGTITGNKIAGQTIEGSNIKGETITAVNIAAGAITASKIAADAITGKTITGGTVTGAHIISNGDDDGTTTDIIAGGITTNNIVITKQGTSAPCIYFKKDASTTKEKGLRFIPANSYEVSGEWNVATLQVLGHTQLIAAGDPEDLAAYMAYRLFVKGDSMFSGNILPGYNTCEIGLPDDRFDRISARKANIGAKTIIGNDVGNVSDPGLYVTAGDIRLTGDGNIFVRGGQVNQSDRNLKHDIQPISEKYEELFLRLKPCTYVFDGRVRTHIGMISQDVVEEMEECGITSQEYAAYCKDPNYVIDKEGNRTPVLDEHGEQTYTHMLRYEEFIGLNTHMIQKLYARVTSLETELEALKTS